MHVSEADDGREIEVAVGETLELALPETSGTGFRSALTSRADIDSDAGERILRRCRHRSGERPDALLELQSDRVG
jgi:hypothetical protein